MPISDLHILNFSKISWLGPIEPGGEITDIDQSETHPTVKNLATAIAFLRVLSNRTFQ